MTRVLGFLLMALCLAAVASVSAARIGTQTDTGTTVRRTASMVMARLMVPHRSRECRREWRADWLTVCLCWNRCRLSHWLRAAPLFARASSPQTRTILSLCSQVSQPLTRSSSQRQQKIKVRGGEQSGAGVDLRSLVLRGVDGSRGDNHVRPSTALIQTTLLPVLSRVYCCCCSVVAPTQASPLPRLCSL